MAVALLLDQHVALGSDDAGDSQEGVMVSSECAAVLVAEGFIVGGIATAVIASFFPLLLEGLGFTAIGVEAGSKAALWQSTFPLVKAGSLFAKLQSIVMSGAESTVIVPGSIVGGAVGGATAASQVHRTCQVIDDVEPESTKGKAIRAITVETRKVLNEGNYVWEEMKDHAGEAKMVLIHKAEVTSGYVKHTLEHGWEHIKGWKQKDGYEKRADELNY